MRLLVTCERWWAASPARAAADSSRVATTDSSSLTVSCPVVDDVGAFMFGNMNGVL